MRADLTTSVRDEHDALSCHTVNDGRIGLNPTQADEAYVAPARLRILGSQHRVGDGGGLDCGLHVVDPDDMRSLQNAGNHGG